MTVASICTIDQASRMALAGLYNWLLEANYNQHCREAIVRYTAAEGTPTACPELDHEDEAPATEVYLEGLEPVPLTSREWDVEDVILDVELLITGTHPFPIAGDPDPDDYDPTPDQLWQGRTAGPVMPPISGGAPGEEPYSPTPSDWAEYSLMFDNIDRRTAAAIFSRELMEDLYGHDATRYL